ncbi:MAG: DEAD/DEAH box helicase [Vulcanimicrobiota bacterium]
MWLRDAPSGYSLEQLVPGLPNSDAQPLELRLPNGPVTVSGWPFEVGPMVAPLARLPVDCPAGSDLRVFSLAARWLLALLVRQRWLPSVQDGQTFFRPSFDDMKDQARLQQLEQLLPPSARAAQPELSPRQVLERFAEVGVHQLLSDWLGEGRVRLPANRLKSLPEDYASWLTDLAQGHIQELAPTLERELARWQMPLAPELATTRLAFALVPPDQGGWRLEIRLESRLGPGLSAGVEDIWDRPHELPQELRLDPRGPMVALLVDLGRAIRVFPELGPAMAGPRPEALELDHQEVYQFLRSTAWLLEEMGFGVGMPSSLRQFQPLSMHLSVKESAQGGKGLDILVDYDWQVRLGEQPLNEAELRQLAGATLPLVCLRGQWYLLEPDSLRRALELWNRGGARGATLGEALAASRVGLAVDFTFEGGLAGLSGRFALEPPPSTLRAQLRPYQERGYSWLVFLRERGLGACLADDMGLGKTVQLIALLLREREQHPGLGPTLLVCPTSIVGNWCKELERFGPELQVMVHHGPGRPKSLEPAGVDLVVTTYGLVHRDRQVLARVKWRGLVLDEAQNVKNPASLQAKAVRAMTAGFRVAMTGTPVENRLADLWALMDFLQPRLLGTRRGFQKQFAVPIERYGDEACREGLKNLVGPFLLRRKKTDPDIAPDLPDKVEYNLYCRLTGEQSTLYEQAAEQLLEEVSLAEGITRKGLVLKLLTRLKQLCNHPGLYLGGLDPMAGRSGKLERLEEMLEEVVACGDAALVFTQFAGFAQRLAGHLSGRLDREVLCLHGGLSRVARDRVVHRFSLSYGPPVMVISVRAGGVGLNLTRASRVFHFDRWWNPAVEAQATDRAFRIGQTRKVEVYKFICSGTLEERIDLMLAHKARLAETVVGSGEDWLTSLDDESLGALLRLERR